MRKTMRKVIAMCLFLVILCSLLSACSFGEKSFIRSGQHCAKLLDDFLETPATIRASIYFYNDESDIDALVEALKTGGDYLDAYFN